MAVANSPNPLLTLQDPPSSGGSVQYQMMCALANAFEQGKKQQDAEPNATVAYVEQAYAKATQNMSFEARQAYWKMLTTKMEGLPNALEAFFEGQNNLFNNNAQLEKLFKDLENWEGKFNSDSSEASKDEELAKHLAEVALAALFIPAVGPLIAELLAVSAGGAFIAALVKASEASHDAEKVSDLKESIGGVEGAIEGQSQALANQLGSSATQAIGQSNMVANSMTNLIKTNNDAAIQICKSMSNNGS